MMVSPTAIRLSMDGANGRVPEPCKLVPPEAVLDGEPIENGAEFYASTDGSLVIGIWESTPYAETIDGYPGDEFCQVLEGRASLTDEDGNTQTFVGGDSYIVPKGFRGVFRVEETFRKYYCLKVS